MQTFGKIIISLHLCVMYIFVSDWEKFIHEYKYLSTSIGKIFQKNFSYACAQVFIFA